MTPNSLTAVEWMRLNTIQCEWEWNKAIQYENIQFLLDTIRNLTTIRLYCGGCGWCLDCLRIERSEPTTVEIVQGRKIR